MEEKLIETMERHISDHEYTLEELDGRVSDLERENPEDHIYELETEIQGLEATIEDLETRLSDLGDRVTDLEADINA